MTDEERQVRGDQPGRSWKPWLAPPLSVFVFLIDPIFTLLRPAEQLRDPGTGWHLATGRYIAETGVIPAHDLFSYTAADHVWIHYYWLFDLGAAWLERLGGIPLYAVVCMLIYAFVPVLVFQRALRLGAGILPALLATTVAYVVLRSHALARPHVLTYLFFAILLLELDAVRDGRRSARSLWWLPLLAVFWCNVHGGFAAGIATVGIFGGVSLVRGLFVADADEVRSGLAFGGVAVAMGLATLVNPAGIELHAQIARYLAQPSIQYFNEFQSPNFLAPSMAVGAFELMIVALFLLVAIGGERLTWIETATVVFFLHEALHSQRHMNLFAIVAAPLIARGITPLFARLLPGVHRRWTEIAAEQAALRSPRVYYPALCGLAVVLAATQGLGIPRTLDDMQLTRGAATFIAEHRDRFARPFNTDNLGGSLIYRFWPDLRVFMDDRIFVYGEDFVSKSYMPVFLGHREWRDVLASYRVTAAVIAAGAPCATLFRDSSDWTVAYEDDQNLILFPTAASGAERSVRPRDGNPASATTATERQPASDS